VHEHVEADVLLKPDHALDLAPHAPLVLVVGDLGAAQRGPRLAHLRGLREGADRAGREARQPEPLVLDRAADLERAGAPRVLGAQAGHPRADRGVARPGGLAPALERPPVPGERLRVAAARQQRELVELLDGERHPSAQLGVERGLRVEVDGHVLKRARGGDDDLGSAGAELVE